MKKTIVFVDQSKGRTERCKGDNTEIIDIGKTEHLFQTKDGVPLMYGDRAAPLKSIPVENKISLDSFMKTVWQLSFTNLHYIDFVKIHKESLKRMFNPEKF